MSLNRICILAACCVLGFVPVVATLADEVPEDEGERCIDIRRISHTDVVDENNILFYMRGGVIYRNALPHKCRSLKHDRAFMYRTSTSRLCDVDIITALYDYGFGFTPGASCGLGKFYPITEEEAKALKAPPDDLEPEEVPPAEPEEPEADS